MKPMAEDPVALARNMLAVMCESARAHNLQEVEVSFREHFFRVRLNGQKSLSVPRSEADTEPPEHGLTKEDLFGHSQWEPMGDE